MAAAVLAAVAPQEDGNDMNAKDFLTEKERDQVSEAVCQAEKITSGEIVPMIVSRSHDYPLASITGATIFSLPISLFFAHFIGARMWLGQDSMWLFLLFFTILYLVSFFVIRGNDHLKALFLHPKQVEHEVSEGALAAFYTGKLYKTEQENGILLYISVLERRVWVLADSGISARIPQENWDTIVDDLTQELKAGQRCPGICKAVGRIGQILQEHFPGQKDDQDELHNLIIRT